MRWNVIGIEARVWLARALLKSGRFGDALRHLDAALASPSTPDEAPFIRLARALQPACAWAAAKEDRVAEALRGQRKPADAEEAAALAWLAWATGHHATTTRLCDDLLAGAGEPALLLRGACSAANAAAGRGEGIEKFSESTRRRWGAKAVEWLRLGWDGLKAGYEGDPVASREAFTASVSLLLYDPDFEVLRDAVHRARFEEDDGVALAALWKEVRAYSARAAIPQ